MKTHLKKYLVIALMAGVIPFGSIAQSYDQSMQPSDPGDTTVSPQDQQLDQAEAQQAAPPEQAPVSTQTFYDQLSPYGQWVNMPPYGYVWIPSAAPGFVPYSTNGHWVYTEYGWTWVSDYAWGWAPFHYGRWQNDPEYGWFWIPDIVWGPAWVCWRHCDGYYGWAPLGWGMNIRVGYYGDYGIPSAWWLFVGDRYITDRYISRYYLPRAHCDYLYAHSTVLAYTHYDDAHHVAYAMGPRREDVAAITHTPVRQIAVRPTAVPAQRYDNAHLHIYKPEVTQNNRDNTKPVPTRPVQQNQVPRRSEVQAQQRSAPVQRSAPMQQRSAPQRSAPVRSAPARSGGGGRHR
ncbi:MAG: DUF6600 domain-containing protein [Bacteroidia bacterium]